MENLKTIVCLFSKLQAQNKSQQIEKNVENMLKRVASRTFNFYSSVDL